MTEPAQQVAPATHGWKWMQVQITNLPDRGAGLILPTDLHDNPVGSEIIGQFIPRMRMPIALGIDERRETLWIPAELIHWHEYERGPVRAGLQFGTREAMQFFSP